MVFYSNDYSKDFLRKMNLIEEEILKEEEEFVFESLLIHENLVEKTITGTVGGIYRSLKKYFEAFISAVKGIYKKFIDNVTRLFKQSEKWLEQNKDYIFNSDLKNFKYEIFPYWVSAPFAKRIDNDLPQLNDGTINLIIENDNNKEYFIQECLKKVGLGNRNIRTGNGFEDDLKTVLRGNLSKKILGSELSTKISDIYEYCINYKDEHKKVKNLVNTIINGSNNAINKLREAERNNPTDPNQNKENKQNMSESSLLESFVLLEEIKENSVKQPTKGAAELAKAKNSATSISDINSRNKEHQNNNLNQNSNMEDNKYKGKSKSEIQKLISAYKIFLEVEQKFLSIRISIMEEKFKVYMSLLRAIAHRAMGQTDKRKQTGKTANNSERTGRLKF